MFCWLAAAVVFWPAVASFADDVGYLGEARLLLAGHLRPSAGDIGIWQHGVAKYPLFPSLLFSPLLAVWPRAVFAVGIGAALLTCWLASRVLESWGNDPAWALVLLAHPTLVIISRTATADVPLCALMLATWWSFRNERWSMAVVSCTALFLIKVTGGVIAVALLGGELLRRAPGLRRGEPEARAALRTALLAAVLGAVAVAAANRLATGGFWFAYEHPGVHNFWPSNLLTTAPSHLLTLVLMPPLLIVGAVPFFQRRELGPLAVIVGFGALMCAYFFVDTGTSWIETRILAPRLLLPVVVFLLIGYADLLARLQRRLTGHVTAVRLLLVALVLTVTIAISARHSRWQQAAGQALAAAERIVHDRGAGELGVMPEADKPGVMFSGRVSRADRAAPTQAVLLCSSRSASHRAPLPEGSLSCEVRGYRAAYQADGFFVMTRD